jgi:competence protein ComEA
MRTRRPTPEHQDAVARRLAQLSAELAESRPPPDGARADDLHGWGDDWAEDRAPVPSTRLPPAATPPAATPPESGPPESGLALVVPVPGRHASRRAGRVLAAAVPETLRGRVALGPPQVAVLALLIALGLAVTCWWVVRASPSEIVAPAVVAPGAASPSAAPLATGTPSAAAGSAGLAGTAGPTAAAGSVTVDVAGKVRRPGIAVLDPGSRVVDALKAAGGPRDGADLSGLNLARVLVDGEQILVGEPAPVGLAASAVPSAGAPGGPLVNLNTASEAELEALPEVGPVTAQAILAWRTEHGGFTSVDELLEVDGIGDATLGQLAPYVTV